MLTKLGKYEIKRELGRGAMGVVYEGFDPFIERTVAIKTIQKSLVGKPEAQEIFNRFRREAQAAGRLNHPNIVSIYEYGEEGEMAYIVMEFIVGRELKDYFDKAERFQIGDSASIMFQLLEALEYSHNRGVVHRDIKPSNIMITQDGQIKIADFGIARIESSDFTQVGTVLGTPSYMSPEQFLGMTADRRSDLYSAGVILYQLLTGERPFTGSNMTIIMHKVLNQAPVLPSALNPGVSNVLDEVVKKAMSKRPEDRFQTAAAFITAFRFAIDILALSQKGQGPEATIKITNPEPPPRTGSIATGSMLQFDVADIEKRLEESRRATSAETLAPAMPEEEDEPVTFVPAPAETAAPASAPPEILSESSLLAGLALEAKEKLGARKSAVEDKQARLKRVNDAMIAIVKFFTAFNQHVNNVEPEINRSYSLDARTTYSRLKWQRATIDFRKQDLSDDALLATATFSVNLCAPEPVLVKRPWDQLEALRRELHHLSLRVLDDLDEISKRPKQEWLEARLAPDFPVQLKFHADYDHGCIEVRGRNIGTFGVGAFKLKPEDVTPQLMDGIGLFLLGRSDRLPASLRHA